MYRTILFALLAVVSLDAYAGGINPPPTACGDTLTEAVIQSYSGALFRAQSNFFQAQSLIEVIGQNEGRGELRENASLLKEATDLIAQSQEDLREAVSNAEALVKAEVSWAEKLPSKDLEVLAELAGKISVTMTTIDRVEEGDIQQELYYDNSLAPLRRSNIRFVAGLVDVNTQYLEVVSLANSIDCL